MIAVDYGADELEDFVQLFEEGVVDCAVDQSKLFNSTHMV